MRSSRCALGLFLSNQNISRQKRPRKSRDKGFELISLDQHLYKSNMRECAGPQSQQRNRIAYWPGPWMAAPGPHLPDQTPELLNLRSELLNPGPELLKLRLNYSIKFLNLLYRSFNARLYPGRISGYRPRTKSIYRTAASVGLFAYQICKSLF